MNMKVINFIIEEIIVDEGYIVNVLFIKMKEIIVDPRLDMVNYGQ
jgi:hypothetical protein